MAKLCLDGVAAGTVKSYILVRSPLYTNRNGSWGPSGGVNVTSGIHPEGSEENGGKGDKSTAPYHLEITKAVKGGVAVSGKPGRCDDVVGSSVHVLLRFPPVWRGGVVPSEAGYDTGVHLSQGDVRVNSVQDPQYLEVRIKASKTDPFRKGVTVYLGRTGKEVCPVAAILGYITW